MQAALKGVPYLSINKALHELQRREAARRGQAVPLPEVVDVEVSVSGPNEPDEMALIGKNRKSVNGGLQIIAALFYFGNNVTRFATNSGNRGRMIDS
jgi:hypothetical protein